jgi:hypothetical protein
MGRRSSAITTNGWLDEHLRVLERERTGAR